MTKPTTTKGKSHKLATYDFDAKTWTCECGVGGPEATVELVDTTEITTTHVLTSGEADSITGYNDLHFALTHSATR